MSAIFCQGQGLLNTCGFGIRTHLILQAPSFTGSNNSATAKTDSALNTMMSSSFLASTNTRPFSLQRRLKNAIWLDRK